MYNIKVALEKLNKLNLKKSTLDLYRCLLKRFQKFLDSKGSRQVENNNTNVNSTNDVTPYDFSNESPSNNTETDPFKDFGDEIKIGDNELPF